ncbi:MAG: AlpA family phage regulatory protein [Methylococcaceae bacterium]
MSTAQIPATGFLRLSQIIGSKKNNIPPLFPVSRSTWLNGCKSGRYPAPLKLGARSVGWRVEDVLALIANPQIS